MKKFITLLIVAIIIFLGIPLLKIDGLASNLIQDLSRQGVWFIPILIISALMDSINPCAFSVLLLTVAFLVSLENKRTRILKIGGMYIIGIFVIYLLIGLGILRALTIFGLPNFMAKIAALILIIFGVINMLGHLYPKFPIRLQIPHGAHSRMAKLMERASMPAALGLGALVASFEFPCTGGPYLLILGLLHDKGSQMVGLGYLIIYNIIFIIPLAILLFIASDEIFLAKVQSWRGENVGNMKLYGGLAMVILGIIMFIFN